MDDILHQLLNRQANTHKYDYGHVLVIGGDEGMAGAALLSARAALKAGAGMVSISSPAAAIKLVSLSQAELMSVNLETVTDLDDFIKSRKVSTVIYGPGHTPDRRPKLLRYLITTAGLDLIIDGGGLRELADNIKLLNQAKANIILTPHLGEFVKLSGEAKPETEAARTKMACNFTGKHDVVLVLKGHRSIVSNSGKVAHFNSTGNPGMATAGSGDVLAGIIGGLTAQTKKPLASASLGASLHGLAGDIAQKEKTAPALIASDLIDFLPSAFKAAGKKLS